ncbi:MAG: AMP-binding protein [Symploca sp. SIO2D2]|nr:AMP-binding protein [Symploca sp. SIO2D2]
MSKLSTEKLAIAHGSNPQPEPNAPTTFTEVLRRITPDRGKVILLAADGRENIQTYATLKERATRILGGLRDFGLQPGNPIILQVERPDFISAFWSCILGGFLPVPISIAPDYEQSNQVLTKLYDVWNLLNHPPILTTAVLAPQIYGAFERHGAQVQTPTVEILETYAPDHQWYPSQPDDPALLLLSSGTTGQPKLITYSHGDAVRRFSLPNQNSLFGAQTIDLRWTPLDHINGLRIILPHTGDKIHLSTAAFLQNPLLWLDIIQKYRVTHAVMLNFALKLVFDCLETVQQPRWNLSSLKQIIIGAEPIVAKTARTFLKKLSVHGLSPDVLCPSYSMSEIGPITRSKNFLLKTTSDEDPFVIVGKPTPRHSIRIVDAQGHLLREGEIGSIEATGATMTVGYYQNPAANRTAFTADGWFRTGDLGFIKDGCLTVTGREKEIIIINGANYHAHQIDKIVEEIKEITPSYTVACGVRQPNSNTDKLAIFFHTPISAPNPLALLLQEIRRTVVLKVGVNPTYLIPVEQSVIPKTGTGKIQRLKLKQRFEAGEFELIQQQVEALPGRKFVAPRTETEKAIAAIWREVLGVEVGVDDDFFELGGHSLLVPQIMLRVQQAFKVALPLRTLFESPTISQLAQTLNQLSTIKPSFLLPPASCLLPCFVREPLSGNSEAGSYKESWWGKSSEYPLSPELELYWVGSQLSSANTFSPKYSIQNRSTWKCQLDPVLFQRACDLVVERNEILRTRLIQQGSTVLQLLSKLLPNSSVNQGSSSKLKQIEQTILALLEKPNSIGAKLVHRLIAFKINLELTLVRQQILPPQPVKFTYYDHESITDESAFQPTVEEIATTEVEHPFDLNQGPLLRCAVIKNSNQTLTVIITVHHGFVDFTGVQQVAEELYSTYQALATNQLDSLVVRPQYRDYATRWASLKNSLGYQEDLNFWQNHFAPCQPLVIPPQPGADCREDFQISEPVQQKTGELIHAYCQEIRVPTSAFFLAGYYLLLHRITKETNLYAIVNNGTRPDLESESTIGTFLQLFPLAVNLTQTPTIKGLIQASASNIFALLEHRRVSLPRLVSNDIRLAAAMMKQPACIFQVIQTTQKPVQNRRAPSYLIDAPDWRFDIFIHGSIQYYLKIAYNRAFYEHEYVENSVNEYQTIVTKMAINPQEAILNIL